MSVVAVTSTRSSPGVSSLAVALGLVWKRQGYEPLLVEGDPAGGVQGLRFNLAAEPSLATLAADLRRGYESERFVKNAVDLMGIRSLLAPADPLTAWRVLQRNAAALAEAIGSYGQPTVVDLGRIDNHSPALPLAKLADKVLVVTRPRAEDVQSLLFGCRLLRGHGANVALVVVGDRPYRPAEIAELAGVPLAAVIPDNHELAVAFSGGRFSGRKLRRSLLWRSVQDLATTLIEANPRQQAPASAPVVAPAAAPVPAPAPMPAPIPVPVSASAALPVDPMAVTSRAPVSYPPPDSMGVTSQTPAGPAPVRTTPELDKAWPPPVRPQPVTELSGWHIRPRGVTS